MRFLFSYSYLCLYHSSLFERPWHDLYNQDNLVTVWPLLEEIQNVKSTTCFGNKAPFITKLHAPMSFQCNKSSREMPRNAEDCRALATLTRISFVPRPIVWCLQLERAVQFQNNDLVLYVSNELLESNCTFVLYERFIIPFLCNLFRRYLYTSVSICTYRYICIKVLYIMREGSGILQI